MARHRSSPHRPLWAAALLALLLLTALSARPAPVPVAPASDDDLQRVLAGSLRDRGAVSVADRVRQDAVQRACSDPRHPPSPATRERLRRAQAALVRYPADGRYLGDWRAGEAIAQSGSGLQFSDRAGQANGGNCYACHQLDPREVAYGNLGPSLVAYGSRHGTDTATLRSTWRQLYNPQAVDLCAQMPRFGQHGILTEQQLQDVMALLFDPASPVNQPVAAGALPAATGKPPTPAGQAEHF